MQESRSSSNFNLLDLTSTWVKTDLYGGVYDAISECAERGYEDFVLMTADVERMRTRSERYQGAVDALAERGIGCEQLQITHEGPPARELRRYLEQQLNPARRTLVFCAHQWALPRVFEALSDMRHLVPEQIGLLGLNNAEWAGLTTPSISTIVEPVEKEGRIACSMLIDLMRDPNAPPQQKGRNTLLGNMRSSPCVDGISRRASVNVDAMSCRHGVKELEDGLDGERYRHGGHCAGEQDVHTVL